MVEESVGLSDKVTRKALGEELRLVREELGWSRGEMVAKLPSRICERTLLSYEHGTRQLTVSRLVELSEAAGVAASSVLALAIQRARVNVANLELSVDLRALLADSGTQFRAVHQWARNKLNECPDGIGHIPPVAVRELATFLGCGQHELVRYLSRFTPDYEQQVLKTRPTSR